METINITPDPKVLIALTHTPMQPLDALCELIDNAIDSFQVADLTGNPVDKPLVIVDLPSRSEINSGRGALRVRDNGPGLTAEMAQNALRAGFSGNNPYDSLGLFGMGLNISTGKLGRTTRFISARENEPENLEITINLESLVEAKSFKVPIERFEKTQEFGRGTIVQVADWWPEGNPNSGFVKKLLQYGVPTVRNELGRRYATVLRYKDIRIMVNEEPCEPFEHCAWADNRSVSRRGIGEVPAVFRFDELLGSQSRCTNCTAQVPPGETTCPACESGSLRTIEERIKGWVGIQRYDHPTDFGVDLFRNGRAIRIGEKSAFFEFTDEFKRTIADYPIDNPYGRIIGEVHLDHVPVDFLKQDFQRSSPEWQRAMTYLRGDTSLQPRQLGPDERNDSPVFTLYQGYRRVRTPGKTDMYMGYWDPEERRPKRISRAVEEDLLARFRAKEAGYYDDTEWWRKVEEADTPPVQGLVDCPTCNAQNLEEHETCSACGQVLKGKTCVNADCAAIIPLSAVSCPVCGASQIPEIAEPWQCDVCGAANRAEAELCSECAHPRGSLNPLSLQYLVEHSNRDDGLSISACSVLLADGSYSDPVDVHTYVTSEPIRRYGESASLPMLTFREEAFSVFVDKTHEVFASYRLRPEHMIAFEIASFIFDANRRLTSEQYRGKHSMPVLAAAVLEQGWAQTLRDTPEKVRDDIQRFFAHLQDRLVNMFEEKAADIFDELGDDAKRLFVENILGQGIDVGEVGELRDTGKYFKYLDPSGIVEIFRRHPDSFFDGAYWQETYSGITGLPEPLVAQTQERIRQTYENCLEDVLRFIGYSEPEAITTQRARASLDFLQQKVG